MKMKAGTEMQTYERLTVKQEWLPNIDIIAKLEHLEQHQMRNAHDCAGVVPVENERLGDVAKAMVTRAIAAGSLSDDQRAALLALIGPAIPNGDLPGITVVNYSDVVIYLNQPTAGPPQQVWVNRWDLPSLIERLVDQIEDEGACMALLDRLAQRQLAPPTFDAIRCESLRRLQQYEQEGTND